MARRNCTGNSFFADQIKCHAEMRLRSQAIQCCGAAKQGHGWANGATVQKLQSQNAASRKIA
jgi:hypothetical protein